jgi:pyruvate dehydrogenase E1 component alpha subunit
MADPIHGHYRTKEELEGQKAQDPISRFYERLMQDDLVDEEAVAAMRQAIEEEVEDAMTFSDQSPDPAAEALFTDICRD